MAERRILNSWKEIANYLGRGVRTVQRWEAQLALPVHRPSGKEHSAVLAFSSELDEWLNSRPLRDASVQAPEPASTEDYVLQVQRLLSKSDTILQRIDAIALRTDEIERRLNAIAAILPDSVKPAGDAGGETHARPIGLSVAS